jgi:hypothetical protein
LRDRAEGVDFDRIGRKTPMLVDLKPSGANYMEDLYKASYYTSKTPKILTCARLEAFPSSCRD